MSEGEDPLRRERAMRPRSDARRTERLMPGEEDHEPVNPGWRSEQKTRSSSRRGPPGMPTSPQEAVIWLQQGGWRWLAGAAALVVLLLIATLWLRSPDDSSEVSRTQPLPTSGSLSILIPTDLPAQATVTEPPAPPPPAAAGAFTVVNTDGQGLFLRSDHVSDPANVIETLPDGTRVEKSGDDFTGPDRVWRRVRAPSGQEGWVAVEFLEAVQ